MASNLKDHKYYNRGEHDSGQSHQADQTDHSMAESMADCVKEKPISSVAIAVGAGIGAGLLLTAMFSSERRRREYFASRVGNYLRSSVSNAIPDSISDRLI